MNPTATRASWCGFCAAQVARRLGAGRGADGATWRVQQRENLQLAQRCKALAEANAALRAENESLRAGRSPAASAATEVAPAAAPTRASRVSATEATRVGNDIQAALAALQSRMEAICVELDMPSDVASAICEVAGLCRRLKRKTLVTLGGEVHALFATMQALLQFATEERVRAGPALRMLPKLQSACLTAASACAGAAGRAAGERARGAQRGGAVGGVAAGGAPRRRLPQHRGHDEYAVPLRGHLRTPTGVARQARRGDAHSARRDARGRRGVCLGRRRVPIPRRHARGAALCAHQASHGVLCVALSAPV